MIWFDVTYSSSNFLLINSLIACIALDSSRPSHSRVMVVPTEAASDMISKMSFALILEDGEKYNFQEFLYLNRLLSYRLVLL